MSFNDIELRRSIILDHYENPKNKIEDNKKMPGYIFANKDSPSCIDNLNAFSKITKNKISDIKFSGIGCAIATSSTDIMINLLKNKSISEARKIIEAYFQMIDHKKQVNKKQLGDLYVFENIYRQINRIKCAKVGIEAILKTLNIYDK
jgi:nitrogen fixation NifU-like protein